MHCRALSIVLLFCCSVVVAADDLRVLNKTDLAPEGILRAWLREQTHAKLDARLTRIEQLKTPAQIAEYQSELRAKFLESLGEFPERTPLGARIVGRFQGDGYHGEKVIYESRPGFHIPAILYLPNSQPPHPAVLLLCGHTENGKAAAAYQQACILLAKYGCAVLCPDPIGQGERKQFLKRDADGNLTDESDHKSTSEHMLCGVAPILLGRGLATYMIWDAVRGIDYLASRDDIDSTQIGCTGNSGGGNRTSYLMAIDDRIQCAAPGCYITTTRRKNDSPGPGDAEQNTFARIALGIEHADFITMRAPRPTLINSATHDFVPIAGTWETFREAKQIYTKLGHSERIDLVEADEKHGFTEPLRVATTRWMRRWLMGREDPVTESEMMTRSDADLQCSDSGQVLLMPDSRSVFNLYAEDAGKLVQHRSDLQSELTEADIRQRIRELAGIRPLSAIPQPATETRGTIARSGFKIEKLLLRTQDGIPLPALLVEPSAQVHELCIYVIPAGKQIAAEDDDVIRMVRNGTAVLAVDLRGVGETQMKPWRYGAMSGVLGPNSAEFFVAYMLGDSFVGMRAEDILISARYLLRRFGDVGQLRLVAHGELTVAALHAAALEPEMFDRLTMHGGLASWQETITAPVTRGQLINTIHGALQLYDLPDLRRLFGNELEQLD